MVWLRGKSRSETNGKPNGSKVDPAPDNVSHGTASNGTHAHANGSNGHSRIDASHTADNHESQTYQADSNTSFTEREVWFLGLKRRLHLEVISTMDPTNLGSMDGQQLRQAVTQQVKQLCEPHAKSLEHDELERLVKEVLDETFGLGPLEALMSDSSISDILINGPKTVYIERRGKLERTRVQFHDDAHVIQIVQRIAAQTGRRIDETCPTVDARLPDGSRLNAIIPPIAIDGPLVSIRRFGAAPLTVSDLIANNSMTEEMLQFVSACVKARINVLVSGGTGSGKTTLLNCLSGFIPADERVATIEDAAELQLQQPHVVRMETRPRNVEGEGEITTYDLVRNALRMRPDRIIVGECRGPEALDMLQAMNTGHQGSMTTVHANSPRDAMDRLEMMVGMAGFEIPIWIIRRQVASALDIVVQADRLAGGIRRVVKVSEITGIEGDVLSMHDIFEYRKTGVNSEGVTEGYFCATGIRPNLLTKLSAAGIDISPALFERRVLNGVEK